MDQYYTTRDVQGWKGDAFEHQWEKLEIPPGIGRSLARMVAQFGREREHIQGQGNPSPRRLSILPERPSPGRRDYISATSSTRRAQPQTEGRVIESIETDTTGYEEDGLYPIEGDDLDDPDCFNYETQETQE